MKKTLQIARLELNLLFYSPIAWLLMIALFLQLAMLFVPGMAMLEQARQFMIIYPRIHLSALTFSTLLNPQYSVFGNVLPFLYIYMPLLTMGLLSRETSSGTIHLLYSSPLTIRQIVFGKFVAMLVYNLVIIGLMLLIVAGAGLFIVHLDYPHVIVGLLGIYLLLCTYSAIGLFMSSLTTYQVVAAILTFVALAFFSYVGGFFQGTDFVRDLTYSLWIAQRPTKMLMGLLTTRDTIYFLVIAAIFLAMTVSKLRMARDSKKVSFKILRYTLIVIIGVGITYLTSRPGWIGYYDATEIKMNTISKNSQDILKKMGDDPIEVTEYINYLGDGYQNAVPEKRNQDVDRWEQYVRFKPNIHMKWVYYYDSVPVPNHLYKENPGLTAKKIFDTTVKFSGLDADDFKTPAEIRKMVDLGDENARVVMQLKYKDRTTWLRTFNDAEFWPKEPEVMAAMKRMLVTLPRIAFVNDGYERDVQKMGDRDYKVLTNFRTFRYSLINQGFDVDTVSLKTGEIPAGIAALVVADSRTELDPMMLAKIRKYIDGGGNLMVLGEPGKQPINNALMSYMDVRMTDGTIVQRSKDFSYGLVTPWLTSAGGELSGSMKYAREDSVPVSMSGVAGLSCGGGSLFTVRPLLLTDSINDWNKKGAFVLDSAALVYDTANGDQHGAFPTAYSLTRTLNGKEQRILLAGDADFFSNAELSRSNMNTANFLFSNAIFGWFAYGEFPIETTHPRSSDNTVRTSPAWIKTIKVVYFGVIPGLFLIMGTVILIRRKRK